MAKKWTETQNAQSSTINSNKIVSDTCRKTKKLAGAMNDRLIKKAEKKATEKNDRGIIDAFYLARYPYEDSVRDYTRNKIHEIIGHPGPADRELRESYISGARELVKIYAETLRNALRGMGATPTEIKTFMGEVDQIAQEAVKPRGTGRA